MRVVLDILIDEVRVSWWMGLDYIGSFNWAGVSVKMFIENKCLWISVKKLSMMYILMVLSLYNINLSQPLLQFIVVINLFCIFLYITMFLPRFYFCYQESLCIVSLLQLQEFEVFLFSIIKKRLIYFIFDMYM